jgi:hypothetical protein
MRPQKAVIRHLEAQNATVLACLNALTYPTQGRWIDYIDLIRKRNDCGNLQLIFTLEIPRDELSPGEAAGQITRIRLEPDKDFGVDIEIGIHIKTRNDGVCCGNQTQGPGCSGRRTSGGVDKSRCGWNFGSIEARSNILQYRPGCQRSVRATYGERVYRGGFLKYFSDASTNANCQRDP